MFIYLASSNTILFLDHGHYILYNTWTSCRILDTARSAKPQSGHICLGSGFKFQKGYFQWNDRRIVHRFPCSKESAFGSASLSMKCMGDSSLDLSPMSCKRKGHWWDQGSKHIAVSSWVGVGRSSDGVDSSGSELPEGTAIAGRFGFRESSRAVPEIGSFGAWGWLMFALINVNTAHLKNTGAFKRGSCVLLPAKNTVKFISFFAWECLRKSSPCLSFSY